MNSAINITDAYMEGLYKLSDEEKISIAAKLLNSLKGTFKNSAKTVEKRKPTSFLELKGVLSKGLDDKELYEEYIEESMEYENLL